MSILSFSLFLGILYAEPGMSQAVLSSSAIQEKTIHLPAVNQKDVHGKTSGAKETGKTKKGVGEEFMTTNCYSIPDLVFEGSIKDLKSTPQSSLNDKCNATYVNCSDSCLAHKSKSEALKAETLKGKKLKVQ